MRVASRRTGHFYIDETCIGCGACIDCALCVPLCPVDCIHDARTEGVVEGSGGYMRIKELQSWATRAGDSH